MAVAKYTQISYTKRLPAIEDSKIDVGSFA
jgi:hypothetical protein